MVEKTSPSYLEELVTINRKSSSFAVRHGSLKFHLCCSTPELAASFEWLQQLLLDDKLVPHPFEIIPGGLSGVDEGWNRQREGKVRHSLDVSKKLHRDRLSCSFL